MAIFWNIILGIAIIIAGGWLTINRIRFFNKGGKDSLGGNVSLLIVGIGVIIFGIIQIVQQI
jgi:hypothetical protein